jgi:hypothetical protein
VTARQQRLFVPSAPAFFARKTGVYRYAFVAVARNPVQNSLKSDRGRAALGAKKIEQKNGEDK